MAIDDDQRASLLLAKARALVAERVDDADLGAAMPFPGGVALTGDGAAWVLLDDGAETALGRALAWAHQRDLASVRLLVDDPGAARVLARRAAPFRTDVTVLVATGRQLEVAAPADPPSPVAPSAAALALAGLLVDAGAEVVVEHGTVLGEVAGLEVARVVEDDAGARLEVGVGRHDREAFAMVHGEVPTEVALARVVETVRGHRSEGQPAHPLNRLAGERWLRRRIIERPDLVGARRLEAAPGTVPRRSVKDPAAAIAVGEALDGGPLVVAASVGIDLDAVPAAADARAAQQPEAELVLVVPERDDHPATRRLAASLRRPARIVPVVHPPA